MKALYTLPIVVVVRSTKSRFAYLSSQDDLLKRIKHLALALAFVLTAALQCAAQTPAPAIDVTTEADQVRVSTSDNVQAMRVRVDSPGGIKVFDSGLVAGQTVSWDMHDAQGERVPDGVYTCTITTRDETGQLSKQTQALTISSVAPPDTGRGSIASKQSTDSTTPQAAPEATPAPTGTGTPGRVTKWLTSSSLGNSVITESAGKIGIGTAAPSSLLHLSLATPPASSVNGTNSTPFLFFSGGKGGATTASGRTAGLGANITLYGGPGGDAPSGSTNGTGGNVVIYPGAPGSGAGTAGKFGNIYLAGTGGNVGIGAISGTTLTAGSKLMVNGVIQSVAGGFKFPDGTVQTTAATGGGSSSVQHNATLTGNGTSSSPLSVTNHLVLSSTIGFPGGTIEGIDQNGGGAGVYGRGYYGVYGTDGGVGGASAGVRGDGDYGVWGLGVTYGAYGQSNSGDGVHGVSTSLSGVAGLSSSGNGVYGHSNSGTGIYAANGGSGLSAPALRADNGNASGIGIWSTTNSNDANLVVSNDGTGDLIRGFGHSGGLFFQVLNNGTTVTKALQITGGSDLAEHFDLTEQAKPGMVVAIDPIHTGKLTVARGAYNQRVAGIVSGANNLAAGMTLPDLPGAKQSMPVALTGRVWVYCDATRHPIAPGDLLTSSDIPGHAMKVINHARAQGAIIGKAMTGLNAGRGLVLVLVTLQ